MQLLTILYLIPLSHAFSVNALPPPHRISLDTTLTTKYPTDTSHQSFLPLKTSPHTSSHTSLHSLSPLTVRGGSSTSPPTPSTRTFSSFLSCLTFTSVLLNSIRRLIPHALKPFSASPPAFLPYAYLASVLWFLYYESYKGFHLKFIPVYVTRSGHLNGKNVLYKIPPVNVLYSGGWMESSRKRKVRKG